MSFFSQLVSYFFRPLLKDIKASGETRIVLDCKTEHIQEVLKQAQQVGVMTAYHNYFITSLVSVQIRKNKSNDMTSDILTYHSLQMALWSKVSRA